MLIIKNFLLLLFTYYKFNCQDYIYCFPNVYLLLNSLVYDIIKSAPHLFFDLLFLVAILFDVKYQYFNNYYSIYQNIVKIVISKYFNSSIYRIFTICYKYGHASVNITQVFRNLGINRFFNSFEVWNY